jgi:hypothetical protein
MRLLLAMRVFPFWVPLSSVLAAVPPVLDGVIAATIESARDLCPLLSHLGYHSLNCLALFWGNGVMVKIGLQVLMVAFPTLLWRPRLDVVRDADPVVRAPALNEFDETAIFSVRPRAAAVVHHYGLVFAARQRAVYMTLTM